MPGRVPPPEPIIGQLFPPDPFETCCAAGPFVVRPKKNPQKKITVTMKTAPAVIATTDQILSNRLGGWEGSATERCAVAAGGSLELVGSVMLKDFATTYRRGVGTKVTSTAA